MRYKKSVYGIYLLFCSFSVVFADDFSKIEKEMQLDPPGMGHSSDAVTIYSKVRDRAINQAVETQFESIQNQTIADSESKEYDPYLKLNKDGIKVYIYKHKNSDFGTFRAITHINASLDSILAVMLDNKSCAEWIDSCKQSFLLNKISFNEQYHYQVFSIPFPFRNRDFIFHSTMEHDPLTGSVSITMSSVPDYCREKQSELCTKVNQSRLVRVKKSIGTFKLEPDDKGIKITWTQHTDPAGHLPAWLVNYFVKKTPYWTFKNLALMVKEEPYKFAKLIYDIDGFAVALNKTNKIQKKSSETVEDFSFFPGY